MVRVAIVASHPVQYQAPWFRALAGMCDLEVLFCHRQDAAGQSAAGFGVGFEWDVPLTEGFAHRWLRNTSAVPSVDRFGGCDTPDVAQALADGRFDACIVSGWYLKSYVQAIRACWRLGLPVLVRGDSQLTGPRGRVVRAAKYLPYKWFLRRIDAHLYVGSRNRAYLEHYGVSPDRLFFVPHFVDNAWFAQRSQQARQDGLTNRLRTDLGLAADVEVALFAGKLIEKKRPADFVDALEVLAQRGRTVQGVVVGGGPLEAELRARANARKVRVAFAGFRNQSEMPAAYGLADVLVLPSDGRETWGLVVNEALACGVPAAVSADAGSASDLVDDRLTGFSFPCGDVPGLAEAIRRTLDVRGSSADLMRAAIEGRMKQFSLESAVAGTMAAVRETRARHDTRRESPAWS